MVRRILNIVERILVEHDQVGPLACFEGAQILGMQEASGTSRGCGDHLHRSQTRLHHQLHFPMSEVAGKPPRRTAIGAESIRHARVRKGL